MPLAPGTRLGPYEIVELRGKGGMGEVYRARDTRLGRDVAVKVLPAELGEDPAYRRRLEREARTISQLQHPHVCMLLDIGFAGAVRYLVMEHLEGETLEERLRGERLGTEEILRIGAEIAAAVDAAHRRGVVHRDLKPGNVMLTESGVKVLDFGLAREIAPASAVIDTQVATAPAITVAGTLVGTMPYMAPEQLQGRPADARTDVWALGCILYEMAAGERPFRGGSQADLVAAILGADPEPPSRRRPLAPEALDGIVRGCLAKAPEDRPASAGEVAEAIEVLRSAPAPRSESSPTAASSHPRRSRRLWLTVTAAAILVAIAAGLWLSRRSPASPATHVDPTLLGVLPFENLSGEPELDQLAMGIADDVITRLAGRRQVATRDTSFAQRGRPVCDAAREIGALVMLHGSVRRQGTDSVRVSAQYIRCPQQDHLWADSFDLADADLTTAQDGVARAVAAAANDVIWEAERTTPGHPYWHLMQLDEEHNATALRLFEEHIERDPADVDPHVGVYWTHMQRLSEGFFDEPPEVSIAAIDRAGRACLDLRPTWWLCYQIMGDLARLRGEREKMIAAAQRVVELSGDIALDYFLPRALAKAGDGERALALFDDLDARRNRSRSNPYGGRTEAHFATGDYAEAARWAERSTLAGVNTLPTNTLAFAHQMVAASRAHLGEIEAARRALAEARRLRPRLSAERMAVWFAASAHRDRYLEGLHLAGLPRPTDG